MRQTRPELSALRKAILDLHGARAEHMESVPVVESTSRARTWKQITKTHTMGRSEPNAAVAPARENTNYV
jgi:hypothetical protein